MLDAVLNRKLGSSVAREREKKTSLTEFRHQMRFGDLLVFQMVITGHSKKSVS